MKVREAIRLIEEEIGHTREEVEREMRDAIEFRLEGLRLEGQPIPAPQSEAAYCEV